MALVTSEISQLGSYGMKKDNEVGVVEAGNVNVGMIVEVFSNLDFLHGTELFKDKGPNNFCVL